jgi:3',5'-cyclic AMP phosphodiesterase CpdA
MGRTRKRVLTSLVTAVVVAGTTVAATSSAAGKPPITPTRPDSRFSIAVIPDTQNEVQSPSSTRFAHRVGWLVSQRVALDLRYAVQIGDLTSWGHVDPAQFAKAGTEARPLEAVIPWSVAAGNHDTAAVCPGGSACPGANTSLTVRDVSTFNRYFPPSRFPALRGTYEPNHSENSYATFSAGGKGWLVLTLELWPRTAVIDWANRVVAANPTRNVIVNTHAYLTSTGSISTSNGGYGANSPRYLFDHLVKVHPNIVMVLSGHTGQGAVRTDTGLAGNRIVSLLQAFHSTSNPVRIVEIDTAAGTVTSRVHVPLSGTTWAQYATSTTGMRFR